MAIEEHIKSYSDLLLSSKNIVFEEPELVKPTFLNRLQQNIVSYPELDINSLSQNEINQIDFVHSILI